MFTKPLADAALYRLRRSTDRAAMSLLCVACYLAPWGSGTVVAAGLTPITAAAFALAAMLPVTLLLRGRATNLRPFDILPLVILTIVGISVSWTKFPLIWKGTFYWYIACSSLYYAARMYLVTVRAVKITISLFALGALTSIIFLRPLPGGDLGLSGTNQNFTAYAYAFIGFVLMCAQHMKIHHILKIAALFVYFLLAIVTIFLGTRGALISFVLMIAWFVYSWAFGPRLSRFTFFGGGALALLMAYGMFEWIPYAIESVLPGGADLSGRMPVWRLARTMIQDNLWAGVGAGAFRHMIPEEIGAHNLFLTLPLDAGLIGLFTFLVLIVAGMRPGMASNAAFHQRYILGLFSAMFYPIASSGHIELAPFMWVTLGLTFSFMRAEIFI